MPPIGITLGLILAVSHGCGDSLSSNQEQQPLRVGATRGLTTFTAGSQESGSSAGALGLILDPTEDHILSASREGRNVKLHLRPDSVVTADVLASTFRFESLVTAKAVDHHTILLSFADEEGAKKVTTLTFGGFALGPFELGDLRAGTASLLRKSEHAIGELLITEVSAADEWRLFLGGSLDVVPLASFTYRSYFDNVPSVRIVDYPPEHSMGLLFNTATPVLSSPQTRRRLASLINRRALSRVLFGSEHQALEAPKPLEGLPSIDRPLVLAYIKSDTGIARTASIIRFQLAEHGVAIELVPLDIQELIQTCFAGKFDMTLLPIPDARRGYDRFLSSHHPESGNITGYTNPDFDAAFDANQIEVMDSILRRDLPATLLFTEQFFAAVPSKLCLDVQPKTESWRWMAALYPCSEAQEQ